MSSVNGPSPAPCGSISDGKFRIAGEDLPGALSALADQLALAGIAPGRVVALHAENTLASALTLLALLDRGVSLVLLPAGPRTESEPSLPRFVELSLKPQRPDPASLSAGQDELPWLPPRGLEWLGRVVHAGQAGLAVDSPLRRDRLFLRTSGSLGAPKWVCHRQAGLWANARAAGERLGLLARDRVLIPVPLAHMYSLGAAFLPAVLAGAQVELLAGANLLRYLDRERRFQPTLSYLTPSLASTLLRARASTASYRAVVIAGDRLSAELQIQAEACYGRVINLYGSTEMGVICAHRVGPNPGPPGCVGPPINGVDLRLLPPVPDEETAAADHRIAASSSSDADTETEAGEIHCRHPHGFVGYVDDDGYPLGGISTGWYATRDLGRRHRDGSLEVLGRIDHATQRDGRLVMLAEVEQALCELPEVERAAVILGEPTLRGRALLAFVSARPEHQPAAADLLRLCRQRLPSFAVPDQLRVLASLPLLPGGKLDRQALARLPRSP